MSENAARASEYAAGTRAPSEDNGNPSVDKCVRRGFSFENEELRAASELFEPREGSQHLWLLLAKPKVVRSRQSDGQIVDAQNREPAHAYVKNEQHARFSAPTGLRRVVLATILLAMLPVTVLASAFTFSAEVEQLTGGFVSGLLGGSDVSHEISQQLACATRERVLDSSGRTAGWIPVAANCLPPGQDGEEGQVSSPHLWTSPIEDESTLEFLSLAIAALEGDHNGPGTLFALNSRGLARAAMRETVRIWSPELERHGGSTAVLSGFETLRDLHGRKMSAQEKLGQMRDMVAYVATALPQGMARDQFAATTNPVLLAYGTPAGGMSISGSIALEILFGRDHIESHWEACVFVAAFRRQILLPAPSTIVAAPFQQDGLFEDRLSRVKYRANNNCLTRFVERGWLSAAEAELARRELEEFTPHAPYWAHGTGQHLPGAFAALRDNRLLAGPWSSTARTFLDAGSQRALSTGVDALRHRTFGLIGDNLCYVDCGAGEHTVDILAVAVELGDAEEIVVAIHQTRGGLFHGPLSDAGAGYVRGEVTRSLGSLPKLYLALRLAAHGITHLCPRDALGLSEADGSLPADCDDPGQWLSLEESLASSSNRALAEGIRLIGLRSIVDGMQSRGADVTKGEDRRRIVTGVGVPNSPERFLRFLASLARGRDGQAPVASLPQISGVPRQVLLELPRELFEGDMALLRDVLAAPVLHPRGTLRALREPLIERSCDLASIIAKTGSSETADQAGTGIRDRYIALRVICPDSDGVQRDIAVFAMVGSPRIDVPLVGVNAADLRALALDALDAGLMAAAAETHTPTDVGE